MSVRALAIAAAAGLVLLGACRAGLRVSAPPSGPLYYSDLGPEDIDVSDYPPEQWGNYRLFRARCSQCHTLARTVNAPHVSRNWWQFYIAGMRTRARYAQATPISADEARRIADFLVYDGERRKVRGKAEFDRLSDELERRFEDIVRERVERLQKSNPRVGP